ncbi:MAG: hypothetical protein ACRDND_22560, partial [Streptosporangiaceae bacterium]
PPPASHSPPRGQPGRPPSKPPPRGQPGCPPRGLLELVISWRALAGDPAGPATLSRIGPITGAQARLLALTAAADPHARWQVILTDAEVSRIASDASFGRLREQALPAVQRVALRRAPRGGSPGSCGDLGFHRPSASDATVMRLVRWRGVHHRCAG